MLNYDEVEDNDIDENEEEAQGPPEKEDSDVDEDEEEAQDPPAEEMMLQPSHRRWRTMMMLTMTTTATT